MRKIAFIVGLILLVSVVFASGIVREIPLSVKPGEKFQVQLMVTIDGEDNYYLLEEKYPVGFVASNASLDAGISGGSIKWIEIQGAWSKTLTYDLNAPLIEGTYNFSGKYFVGSGASSSDQTEVGGKTTIIVSLQEPVIQPVVEPQSSTPTVSMLLIAGLAIIILGIGIYFISKKKPF